MKISKMTKKLFCGAYVEIYQIFDEIDGKIEEVGSFELDEENKEELHLEYIYRSDKYKGHKYLEKSINWIFENLKPKSLTALPLKKYRKYYEKLGFKQQLSYKEDIYYIKENALENAK